MFLNKLAPGKFAKTKDEKKLTKLYNKKTKFKLKLQNSQHKWNNSFKAYTELDTLKDQIDELDRVHTDIENSNERIGHDLHKITKIIELIKMDH
jgi:hypothetical protein